MLSLSITGFEGDPDDVTSILGISPTSTGRRGEAGLSGRPHRFNGWWFDAHPQPLSDGAAHATALGAIMLLLEGRAERFARLREQLKPTQITIYGGLYQQPNDQCGVWLDADQMRVLADCGVDWGIDLFDEAP